MSNVILNEWVYKGKPISEYDIDLEDYEGFVYLIKNLNNNKSYIGKKTLWNRNRKQVKKKNGEGKKTKIVKKQSDWKKYWGSNKWIKHDVEQSDAVNFERTILHFFKSKGESNYIEAMYQFKFEVLLNPDDWYNDWIMCKVQRSHLKDFNQEKFKKEYECVFEPE